MVIWGKEAIMEFQGRNFVNIISHYSFQLKLFKNTVVKSVM